MLQFFTKLQGWEKLLLDKCMKNELMDIKSINLPDLSFVPTAEKPFSDVDIYTYATFAKPGHH